MAANTGTAPSFGYRSPVSFVRGFAGGVGAFLLTYVFLFLAKSGEVGGALTDSFGSLAGSGVAPSDWQVVGWLFFEAHNVKTTASVSSLGRSESLGQGLQEAAVWDAWLLFVPVIVLIASGYLVANSTVASRLNEGFKAGAAIVLGYLVMALIGILLFHWTTTVGSVTIAAGPHYITGLLFAGLGYPVVLGGIGGAIASQT